MLKYPDWKRSVREAKIPKNKTIRIGQKWGFLKLEKNRIQEYSTIDYGGR